MSYTFFLKDTGLYQNTTTENSLCTLDNFFYQLHGNVEHLVANPYSGELLCDLYEGFIPSAGIPLQKQLEHANQQSGFTDSVSSFGPRYGIWVAYVGTDQPVSFRT